jgi:hypothetical protein
LIVVLGDAVGPLPLVRHEERPDSADQADDADDPEDDATLGEETEPCHDHEDGTCNQETQADEVHWHSSLKLGRVKPRNVPHMGDSNE